MQALKAFGVAIITFIGLQIVVGLFVGAGLEYDTPTYSAVTFATLVGAVWAGVAWYRRQGG